MSQDSSRANLAAIYYTLGTLVSEVRVFCFSLASGHGLRFLACADRQGNPSPRTANGIGLPKIGSL
eukprot:6233815-Karenia_brevis.AAC.1